ncbi:MAG TPA: hypothetical protein PLO14_15380 [Accumulibacter sp.]|uniref:hypothetical protein n=1 Tax=Accumulibacter sp. TaxID=2053492 RepID=UPI0025FA059A|nr:hypothetical protein [Accumulibacter sp.]MCM8598799.1 hypothetical protein [Accumulibacter sp.]MCM8663791.1 hypothetical protein [Accumulibacter sp.]HNC53588.1 hypothetical protein [Accumulibacter sp.]
MTWSPDLQNREVNGGLLRAAKNGNAQGKPSPRRMVPQRSNQSLPHCKMQFYIAQ